MSTRVLNNVVDSLILRIQKTSLPSRFLADNWLDWQAYIEQYEPGCQPLFTELEGLGTFRVVPYKRAPYGLVLDNPELAHIRVWNAEKFGSDAALNTGQILVDFRSKFLQLYGVEAARAVVERLECLFFESSDAKGWVKISRLDLAVDTEEIEEMRWADLDSFVCRSKKLDTWASVTEADIQGWLKKDASEAESDAVLKAASNMLARFKKDVLHDLESVDSSALTRVISDGRRPKTIYFGRFGSKLYGRRYDKLASLPVQNKFYMLQEWTQNGWTGENGVIRTEFSLSGDFLREFRVQGVDCEDYRDFNLLEENIKHFWRYLTHDWLRRVDISSHSRLKNCNVLGSWIVIQQAWDSKAFVYRDYKRRMPESVEGLLKQARGCIISAAAASHNYDEVAEIFNGIGKGDTIESMIKELVLMLDEGAIEEMDERMRIWGVDGFTDTELTATVRAERMALGYGS